MVVIFLMIVLCNILLLYKVFNLFYVLFVWYVWFDDLLRINFGLYLNCMLLGKIVKLFDKDLFLGIVNGL